MKEPSNGMKSPSPNLPSKTFSSPTGSLLRPFQPGLRHWKEIGTPYRLLNHTTQGGFKLEMQCSGAVALPDSKFRPGWAFCGTRIKVAGLMLASGEAITMYYILAAGLHVVLERCWLGSMLGSPEFLRWRSGLGLGFWKDACISSSKCIKCSLL